MSQLDNHVRFLDLDLDCFIEPFPANSEASKSRLEDSEYRPWSEVKFRTFLESQCALDTANPLPGAVFTQHIELFAYWQRLISLNALSIPFEAVHIDAHSDLGMGDAGYGYVMSHLLKVPVQERSRTENLERHLTSGNYLAFACACRWIKSLVFVHHPLWRGRDYGDLMWNYFKNCDTGTDTIQMCAYRKASDVPCQRGMPLRSKPISIEPEIPISLINIEGFKTDRRFDFATIAQSPGYTPKSADYLIEIFKEYIVE